MPTNSTARTTPPNERTYPFSQHAPNHATSEPPSRLDMATPTPDLHSRFSVTTSDSQSVRSHSSGGSHTAPPASASETQVDSDDGEPAPRKCPVIMTQEIDEELLRTSIEDRIAYLTDFLGFTSRDAEIINHVAPLVHGLIPDMVDGMYEKLFEFDITKRVFMTRNHVRLRELMCMPSY